MDNQKNDKMNNRNIMPSISLWISMLYLNVYLQNKLILKMYETLLKTFIYSYKRYHSQLRTSNDTAFAPIIK